MSISSGSNLLELTVGNGTATIQLPISMANFDYRVVSGPGIPQPASNTSDLEFIDFSLQKRDIPAKAGSRIFRRGATPATTEWYAIITWFVTTPRVIEYAFS